MKHAGQLLMIDADDTLWENNIYFERAIARYTEMLATSGHEGSAIRAHLNSEERRTIAEMGYGLRSFATALTRTFEALTPGRLDEEARLGIERLAAAIANEPIEFLPGAEATLAYLAGRHRLALMTKGDFAEQSRKVMLSGVAGLFEAIHIVPEKDEAAYRARAAALAAPIGATWMIGNSPRSDINPALAAGLNAVFIPHRDTWVLEHDELRAAAAPQQLLRLDRIGELRDHF